MTDTNPPINVATTRTTEEPCGCVVVYATEPESVIYSVAKIVPCPDHGASMTKVDRYLFG